MVPRGIPPPRRRTIYKICDELLIEDIIEYQYF